MPVPDSIVAAAAALVAVIQVSTLAWYTRRWLQRRRSTWLVMLHYGLTFALLLGILYWSRIGGQGPIEVAVGYGVGLVVALALALWKVQRVQARQIHSEE